jgi:transcriptional regulator with XRE-family HTH domain
MSEITPRCLRLRLRLGESQTAFARRIGQSQGTIYRLEAGQPETGSQKLLLDMIERQIESGAATSNEGRAPEISDAV